MLAQIISGALMGIDGLKIEVQVDISGGLPRFDTVGLPEGAVRESKDRVKAALKNQGYPFPRERVTVNLAPADLKKDGAGFDLPMAIGLLVAQGLVDQERARAYLIVGELGLDGSVRPIKGALSLAMAAREENLGLIVPASNSLEAAVATDIKVYPAENLGQVIDFLNCRGTLEPVNPQNQLEDVLIHQNSALDMSEVKGQERAKRALTVAAAGGHNILLIGPPGSGKTMLAQRLPTILPRLSFEEAVETTKIYSAAGQSPGGALIVKRPFRSPHHTISDVALIGGGRYPRPGEVSLAHNGVLFLDELPEFKKNVLEVLRQPLEDGQVAIARAANRLTFPSRFMLVAAMNPCPCGYLGDMKRSCQCLPGQAKKYRGRVSGPLMDRLDIHLEALAVEYSDLARDTPTSDSQTIREQVAQARAIQSERFSGRGIFVNSQMTSGQIRQLAAIGAEAQKLMEMAMKSLGFSARAYSKILKLSRTIADLETSASIEPEHLAEAISYRALDRAQNMAG